MIIYVIKTLLCITMCISQGSANDYEGVTAVTNRSEFAYQATIRLHNTTLICGGVIYNNHTVLTTAQCIDKILMETNTTEGVDVLVGHLKFDDTHNYTRRYEVSSMKAHENYVKDSLKDDIAVIKIKGSFDLNEYVYPLEVLNTSMVNIIHKYCIISGWGILGKSSTDLKETLSYRYVLIKTFGTCEEFLAQNNLDEIGNFCSEPPDRTVFFGDLGGPLKCGESLAGIISGVFNNTQVITYSNADHYREWIIENHSTSLIYSPLCILLLLCNNLFIYRFHV